MSGSRSFRLAYAWPSVTGKRQTLPMSGRPSLETPSFVPLQWNTLWLVMRQQILHDAMFLWRYDRRKQRLHLEAAAPPPWEEAQLMEIEEGTHLGRLADGELHLLAHVQCLMPSSALPELLRRGGMQSALTAALVPNDSEAYLVTCGFRQPWELISHHAESFSAFVQYLRTCHAFGLPAPQPTLWCQRPTQVSRLWGQLYRPTVLRTVYDLTEILADAAEQCRQAGLSRYLEGEQIRLLAHAGVQLMNQLEAVYVPRRVTYDMEELVAEALILVRGAYQICTGEWRGCVAQTRREAPLPQEMKLGAVRHQLVDWLLNLVESE